MARVFPTVRALVMSAAVSGGAVGCTLPVADEGSQPAPTVTVVAEPAPTPTVTVTATPAPPAPVLLSDQGIGSVSKESGDAESYAALVSQLGPPSKPIEEYCFGNAQWAGWGGLTVFFHTDGSLMGWMLAGGPLPDVVRPPYDIYPGQDLSLVLDVGGVPEQVLEPVDEGEWASSVGDVSWGTRGDEPESPIAWIASDAAGCN